MDIVLSQIIDKILSGFSPEKIILFSSYAHGTQNKDSDIDLLVIDNSDLPKYKRSASIRLSLRDFRYPFDILVYSENEFEYCKDSTNHILNEISKTGIVLFDRKAS